MLMCRPTTVPPRLYCRLCIAACCPGAPAAPLLARLAGADVALSSVLTALGTVRARASQAACCQPSQRRTTAQRTYPSPTCPAPEDLPFTHLPRTMPTRPPCAGRRAGSHALPLPAAAGRPPGPRRPRAGSLAPGHAAAAAGGRGAARGGAAGGGAGATGLAGGGRQPGAGHRQHRGPARGGGGRDRAAAAGRSGRVPCGCVPRRCRRQSRGLRAAR